MLQKLIAVSMIGSLLGGLIIMQTTTPATIHPIGLLVFFVCLYIVMLGMTTYILYLGHRFIWLGWLRRRGSMSLWRAYQFGSVVAIAPTMLIAMRTVGVVTLIDLVFIGLFTAVAVFYIAKRG